MKAIDSLKVLCRRSCPSPASVCTNSWGTDQLFGVQHTQKIKDAVGEHTALLYDGEWVKGRWQPSDLKPGAFQPARTPVQKTG